MKITKIERQKKNKERVSVFLDGKYAFSLSEETLLKLRITEGQEVENDDLYAIAGEEENRNALDTVFRLLGIRSRSEKELVQRLRKKKFSPAAIDRAVARVKELGYVNDAKFAREWVRYRTQQGKGPELIKAELKLKGISPEILSEALSELKGSPENEVQRIKDIAERKMKQMQGVEPKKAAQRLVGFLARRGFGIDAIRDALNSLKLEQEDKD